MKYIKSLFLITFIGFLVGVVSLLGIYLYIKPELPSVTVLKDVRLQTPMRIYTHDGKLISQYGVKRRIPVTLEQAPDLLVKAVLATEDSRFYEHFGVDPIGVLRAALNLAVTGEKGQGASTLTMQLARGFFLTREKTYIRKVKEIFIALHMENELSKDEILELYLNKIELGHRSFGFGAAAQVYYGKALNELNLAQIATIAGLPQAPSVLNPISRPERSVERRRIVLLRMLDEQYISREEFEQAVSAPVTAKKHGAEIELDAPYLADLIYTEMVETYGKEEAETGGYQVYASASSNLQLSAQRAVQRNLHDYDQRHGYRGPIAKLWGQDENLNENSEQVNADNLQATRAENGVPADWDKTGIVAALETIPTYAELVPAVVTFVNEDSFFVVDADGINRVVGWEGIDWARPYIADNKQGPDPKKAADVVASGDVVYLNKQDGIWQLSQLPAVSGAFVALNPQNGAVQAVVGGYSFYQSQFNRATQAKRQVGSNIKPFVYSSALDNGYTIASMLNDAPINQWDASSGVAWRPQNSPAVYDGPIRMRVALGKSKNVVSVRLLRGVGLDNTIEHLTKFGFIKEEIPRDETVSLGSGSHTPLEVVRAMAVIANGGYLVEPYFIDRVVNDEGELLWQADPVWACNPCAEQENGIEETDAAINEDDLEALLAAEFGNDNLPAQEAPQQKRSAPQVISAQNAFLVSEMMRTAVRSNGSWSKKTYWLGTGWRARNILGRTDLAGKTGTTNDSRDTWFSGFHPKLVATAWVGFDDMNRQLGRTTRNQNLVNRNPEKFNWIGNGLIGAEDGAKAAGPAWIRFMEKALEDVPHTPMPIPDDIIRVRIDRTSGKLTRHTDHTTLFEYFLKGSEPKVYVTEDEFVDPAEQEASKVPEPEEIF